MKHRLACSLVVAAGGFVWGLVMPDLLSAVLVGAMWGTAVAHFWIRNFPMERPNA